MLFNSIDFAFFLPLTFIVYWFLLDGQLKLQNIFILIASYIFYGWWDWRFLGLIILSTVIDYWVAHFIFQSEKQRIKFRLLLLSLATNLGILLFFKYFNFFVDSFVDTFAFLGVQFSIQTLKIVLPVGISFYTFQTLSYTIDVYREKITPRKDFIAFAAFVSFFPQLVAGPIERASHLLPQFLNKRFFNYDFAVSGIRLIIWGLFKKIAIADNAGIIVDGIFSSHETQSSFSLILGGLLFAFQIYCDFSGYSDIAIGTGRLFGFDLRLNFNFPYFAKNIREFWQRWHISLSTWFRDYLYIPLGGSRTSRAKTYRNILIVFLVSGFWHGANWTFIFWGAIHALLFLPYYIYDKSSSLNPTNHKVLPDFMQVLFTFIVVCFAWIFFRASSLVEAFDFIKGIFALRSGENFASSTNRYTIITSLATINIVLMLLVEYFFFKKKGSTEVRLPNYGLVIFCLIVCFTGAFKNHASFIYFQF